MPGKFEGTAVIDRPVEEVFAYLADGTNDPKFSPRVLAIAKTTDGPPGVGTIYTSTVKDAGMKTVYNVLEGHGLGKLIAPLALRQAQKGADDFAAAIKRAVEAS